MTLPRQGTDRTPDAPNGVPGSVRVPVALDLNPADFRQSRDDFVVGQVTQALRDIAAARRVLENYRPGAVALIAMDHGLVAVLQP